MTLARTVRIYALETKYEFLKLVRMRTYVLFTLLFPLMFYIFFGLAMGRGQGGATTMATYLLGTYGTFAVVGVSLFGFGVGIAVERGLGWLQLKRASPMPPLAGIFARLAVCVMFSAIVIAALFTLGIMFGGVRMPARQWLALASTLLAGVLPFCTLGLAIGNFAKPNSAPGLVNIIYLPMAFCSGLWIPIQFLPDFLKHVAVFLPAYHLSQVALIAIHVQSDGSVAAHWEALAGFTIVFAGLAWLGYRREQEKMYG